MKHHYQNSLKLTKGTNNFKNSLRTKLYTFKPFVLAAFCLQVLPRFHSSRFPSATHTTTSVSLCTFLLYSTVVVRCTVYIYVLWSPTAHNTQILALKHESCITLLLALYVVCFGAGRRLDAAAQKIAWIVSAFILFLVMSCTNITWWTVVAILFGDQLCQYSSWSSVLPTFLLMISFTNILWWSVVPISFLVFSCTNIPPDHQLYQHSYQSVYFFFAYYYVRQHIKINGMLFV